MSLTKKILSNTFIQMFWRITTALMAIISVKLITSTLWVEWYWQYATVYEFLALFAVAWDFWIYTVALREMSSKLWDNLNEKKNKAVSFIYQNILWLRIVLMSFFMLLAVWIWFLIPAYQGTLIPMWILITSIAVFLNLIYSISTSILQLHLKMTYSTIALIIWKIFSVWIIFYWAFFIDSKDESFFTFLFAWILWHLVMLWITFFYAKRFSDISPKFNYDYWWEIFKKAAPYWVAIILWTIYFKIDVFLLSILKDSSQVWIYSVWIRIVEVFAVLPMFFMNSLLPSLTKAVENNLDKSKKNINKLAEKLMNQAFFFMLWTWSILILWTYLFSTLIIKIVSSEEFLSWRQFEYWADYILVLLMIAMFFSFFSIMFSIAFVAFKKQKTVLIINILWVSLNLILNLIYIPEYWYIAAAWTSIISEIFVFILSFIFFQRVLKFFPDIKKIF
jgi:O-antigen/teichoic acid export membrane protein